MVELLPCPACGGESLKCGGCSAETTWCFCSKCGAAGPTNDPTGSRWNALPRATPGTVAVPVGELEALRDLTRPIVTYCGRPQCGDWLISVADRLNTLLAHLPKPDHVAALREHLSLLGPNADVRPALEAAIEAMRKDGA